MNIRNGFNFAKKVVATGECDMLILDEVLGIIDQNIIKASGCQGRRYKPYYDRDRTSGRDEALCGFYFQD